MRKNRIYKYHTALALVLSFFTVNADEKEDSIMTTELNEIVVPGSARTITKDGSVTKIKVHGTPFSQMGSVLEMLGNMPGLYDNGNGIQVSGCGTPVYYLDGRELTQTGQLSVLQSDNIKEVRIDRAPGAEVSAGTNAVIYLTTYRPLHDNLFLNVNNTLGIRRKVSDYPGVNFRVQAGKFVSSANYQFGSGGSEVRETYFRKINHSTYDFQSEQARRLPTRHLSNAVNWSGEYQINATNRVGLYYYLKNDHTKGKESGTNELADGQTATAIDMLNENTTDTRLHSVSGVYDYAEGYKSLHLSQDFAHSSSDSGSSIRERQDDTAGLTINSGSSSYNVATTNIRANFVMPWRVSVSAGARFIYVNSKSSVNTSRDDPGEWLNDSDWYVDEYTPQAYVACGRMFGSFLVSPGLRYEYTCRHIRNRDRLSGEDNLHRYENSTACPFLTLKYSGEKVNAYMQYSRSIVHPDFNMLNSGVSYIDTLTYSHGNPDLKATAVSSVKAGVDIGDFSMGLWYSNRRNPFENIEILKEPDGNTVYSTYINFPRHEQFMTSLAYGPSWGNLNCYGEVDFYIDRSSIAANGATGRKTSFSIDLEANATYQFNDRFSIYANYTLQGRKSELATSQKSVQNLNLGLSGKFLKNRLSINLEFMDMLGKANYNNLSVAYMNVTSGTRGTSDMRGVRLRISYTIFNKQINISGGRENEDILERIKQHD